MMTKRNGMTRRETMTAAFAVAATSATPMATALAGDADADLFTAIAQWQELRSKANQHFKAECALHRQIREGEPDPSKVPPALRWRDGDEAVFRHPSDVDLVKERGYFTHRDIERLKGRSFLNFKFDEVYPPDHPDKPLQPGFKAPNGPGTTYLRQTATLDAAARDRAVELIEAADGWNPAPDPLAERYAAMTAEGDVLSDRLHEMAKAIVAMPAKTIPGLSAKARFAIADEVAEDEFLFNDLAESILGQLAGTTEGVTA